MNLSEDRRFNIVAASVATCILAMLAVVLRNVSRKLKGNKMWLDDWLALASLVRFAHLVFRKPNLNNAVNSCG